MKEKSKDDIEMPSNKDTVNKCKLDLSLDLNESEKDDILPSLRTTRERSYTELNLKLAEEQLLLTKKILGSGIFGKSEKENFKSENFIARANSVIPNNSNNLFKSSISQNIVNVGGFDFVEINDDYINKPKNRKYDDECSICSSKIFFDKYICIICANCCLCASCEKEHCHPVIKCKSDNFSSLDNIFNYIAYSHSPNSSNFSFSIYNIFFHKDIEFVISTFSNNFSMRPNSFRKIEFSITNVSEQVLKEDNELILYARNNKDLIIDSCAFKKKVGTKETFKKELKIISKDVCKKYHFKIEIYSPQIKININKLYINVDVNNDEEDEMINDFFYEYPLLLNLPKEYKIIVKNFIMNYKLKQHPYIICNYLKNNNWDTNLTLVQINGKVSSSI